MKNLESRLGQVPLLPHRNQQRGLMVNLLTDVVRETVCWGNICCTNIFFNSLESLSIVGSVICIRAAGVFQTNAVTF